MLIGATTGFPHNPSDIRTPNNFIQTGINTPNKTPNDPYAGIDHDKLVNAAPSNPVSALPLDLVPVAFGGAAPVDPEASPLPGLQQESGYTDGPTATLTGK
jgi:hypothetical protein